MAAPIETQLLINNKLVPASDNATFDLYSPHTGEVVAKGTYTTTTLILRLMRSCSRRSNSLGCRCGG
jgi:acyl-CoA reductase-like NAD-dependent aldehyde dehydrogenase